jgi:hypothetical protein
MEKIHIFSEIERRKIMETNNILTNEDVVETTSEVIERAAEKVNTSGIGKTAFMVAAAIGSSALAGILAYRFIVKPAIATAKAKKESQNIVNSSANDDGFADDVMDYVDDGYLEDPEDEETIEEKK